MNTVFFIQNRNLFLSVNVVRELACIACATTIHQSHKLVEIKNSVQENLQKINSFIKHSKEKVLPDVVNEIKLTISKLQETKQMCQNEIKGVKEHEDRLRELVEVYSVTKISRLEFLLKETTDVLNRHKVHLENLQEDLEKNTKEYQQTVKAGSGVLLYDTRTQIEKQSSQVDLPKFPSVITSTFVPCQVPTPLIEKAFGELKDDKYNFLHQPNILHTANTLYDVLSNSICRTPNNNAWLKELKPSGKTRMHLIDNEGKERRTLNIDSWLQSICTDPTTGDVYSTACSSFLYRDYSIKRVYTESGRTSTMFTADCEPHSIGCTNDKHLVVGLKDNTVKKFTFNGQMVNTYKHTGLTGISVCSSTNSIALMHSGGVVTVLDQSLQKLYEYRKGQGLQDEFQPCTASFDGKYLLVGSGDNILVLESGKLVHTISTTEMPEVRAICVQDQGVLLVGCDKKILCIELIA